MGKGSSKRTVRMPRWDFEARLPRGCLFWGKGREKWWSEWEVG